MKTYGFKFILLDGVEGVEVISARSYSSAEESFLSWFGSNLLWYDDMSAEEMELGCII